MSWQYALLLPCLGAAHLVAGRDHRRPRGEHEGGEQVADRAAAQGHDVDRGGVGADVALDAVVPRAVVVAAVAVLLPVGRVVLVVVGHQVREREAVVGGDVVDRRAGPSDQRRVAVPEQVDGARQAGGQVADAVAGQTVRGAAGVREPERADGVAEAVVPLGERDRELPGAPAAGADVPRLRDELEAVQARLDRHRDERGVVGRVAARVAAEGHRQVEAEPVDAHDVRPVAQRVEGHPDDLGPPEVERVARARDVRERRGRPAVLRVVGGVVQAAPGQVLAGQPALAGVVVDDVEQHLEAGLVQRVDRARSSASTAAGPAACAAAVAKAACGAKKPSVL